MAAVGGKAPGFARLKEMSRRPSFARRDMNAGNLSAENELSFRPRHLGDKNMRLLGAALVCMAILYGVDAFWFNGLYFTAAVGMMSQMVEHWR
jgi:hypothetical protein